MELSTFYLCNVLYSPVREWRNSRDRYYHSFLGALGRGGCLKSSALVSTSQTSREMNILEFDQLPLGIWFNYIWRVGCHFCVEKNHYTRKRWEGLKVETGSETMKWVLWQSLIVSNRDNPICSNIKRMSPPILESTTNCNSISIGVIIPSRYNVANENLIHMSTR